MGRASPSFTYPLMLGVADRLAVIVGGGAVAARKARGLLEAGAGRIRAVAKSFAGDFPPVPERIEGTYEARHLNGAALVFAATDDPAVNEAVVGEARLRGVLVCRADVDASDPGDFATPALLREGPLTITVSAGGSPALAAAVRDAIRQRLDPVWRAMAEAMAELRPAVLAASPDIARRRLAFRDLASAEAMAVLAGGGSDALRDWLAGRFPEMEGGLRTR